MAWVSGGNGKDEWERSGGGKRKKWNGKRKVWQIVEDVG